MVAGTGTKVDVDEPADIGGVVEGETIVGVRDGIPLVDEDRFV